jgi:predicted MPP superfamily phosphohydrolase
MILLLGDIHGDIGVLKYAIDGAVRRGATALIQVGDFGLFPRDGMYEGFRRVCKASTLPIYFIDGNHDDCTRWSAYTDVTQIWHDAPLFYVPRGTIMELDGKTLAFMGGAGSIDKEMRLQYGWHWDNKENISPEEVLRLLDNAQGKSIDAFITHCPPNSVIEEHFDPRNKLRFGVPLDWHDHNQDIIEHAWKALGYPMIYSGHMHRSVIGTMYRILDINETLEI